MGKPVLEFVLPCFLWLNDSLSEVSQNSKPSAQASMKFDVPIDFFDLFLFKTRSRVLRAGCGLTCLAFQRHVNNFRIAYVRILAERHPSQPIMAVKNNLHSCSAR